MQFVKFLAAVGTGTLLPLSSLSPSTVHAENILGSHHYQHKAKFIEVAEDHARSIHSQAPG